MTLLRSEAENIFCPSKKSVYCHLLDAKQSTSTKPEDENGNTYLSMNKTCHKSFEPTTTTKKSKPQTFTKVNKRKSKNNYLYLKNKYYSFLFPLKKYNKHTILEKKLLTEKILLQTCRINTSWGCTWSDQQHSNLCDKTHLW